MTKQELQNRERFTAIIVREAVIDSAAAERCARMLMRHGATYCRLQEQECNGVGSLANEDAAAFAIRQDRFEKHRKHQERLVETRIHAICKELGPGFAPVFEGDPRAHTLRIKVPSGYQNDGQNPGEGGVSVPTS